MEVEMIDNHRDTFTSVSLKKQISIHWLAMSYSYWSVM